MNKIFILLILNLFSCLTFAQDYSCIKGKCNNENINEVKLFRTIDGKCSVLASTKVASDGSFGFLVVPENPGFYAIGDDRFHYMIYLKGGDNVNLNINQKDVSLSGENSKENQMLYKWYDYSSKVRLRAIYYWPTNGTHQEFFSDFHYYLSNLPKFREGLKCGNKDFDDKLLQLTNFETDYFACVYMISPHSQYPTDEEIPDYYKRLFTDKKFQSDVLLDFPDGYHMMSTYTTYASINHKNNAKGLEQHVAHVISYLNHPRLKGEYLLNSYFPRLKTYMDFLKGKQLFGQYIQSRSLKSRLEAIGTKLYNSQVGMKARDFTYPDINGKMVSLSDFKGKVVLVDVWATWCAPCKKEIPYLIKLEEEMKGTDLVVIGVSVDQARDHNKWINFVKEKGLGGVQLHTNGSKQIKEDYKITGIPRFMVFDKEGKVVTIDAPRPSNPSLKELLQTELNKK